MQNLSKKQWSLNLNLKDGIDLGIDLSVKCRQKNIISSLPNKLYYCNVFNENIDLTYYHSLSSLYKFSQKDGPEIDRARDMVLRMLSVAMKCHYFLYEHEKIVHEPYFSCIPDVSNPYHSFFTLVYKTENKTIIVSEKELKNIANTKFVKIKNNESYIIKKELINKTLTEFPTIVGSDSFKWFHYKKWYILKKEYENHYGLNDKIKTINELKKISSKELLEQKANILNIPYELKDEMIKTGCIWNANVSTWIVPKGTDIDLINHYLNSLKHELNN